MDLSRKAIHQNIDYRIFVISAYQEDELNPEIDEEIQKAISFQSKPSYKTNRIYKFYKYSIDEFVPDFSISRSIDGTPAVLRLKIFPVKDQYSDNYSFFYKKDLQEMPVFRRGDYIEVQVAEMTLYDVEKTTKQKEYDDFRNILIKKKLAIKSIKDEYTDKELSAFYKIRFRGFITKVTDTDSASAGRVISLEAKSMLYFLVSMPFVTNLAIFTERFYETQRIHITNDQYIVLFGNLLQDLRDTTIRTNGMMEQSFIVKSREEEVKKIVKVRNNQKRTFIEKYFCGYAHPIGGFGSILDRLNTNKLSEAKGTQANLLLLAEFYYSFEDNYIANAILYKIFKSEVFDIEIQFEGTNTEFISKYTYLLQILNEFKETIKYFLFEKANGTIIFDRPRFTENPSKIIDSDSYISYDYSEESSGYITEIFVTPGTAFQIFDDTMRETLFQTSGYRLDELRRYGYRRPEPITNPNISNTEMLKLFARTEKAITNAQLKTLTLTIPYDKNIDLGQIVWFQKKQLLGYIIDITEDFKYGGSVDLSITLTYLREVKKLKDKLENITLENFPEKVEVEDFPEYVFISDFYSGKALITDQSPVIDKSERALYGNS